ncbi:unnamed protein product, partial [marine sediment metagenome]
MGASVINSDCSCFWGEGIYQDRERKGGLRSSEVES